MLIQVLILAIPIFIVFFQSNGRKILMKRENKNTKSKLIKMKLTSFNYSYINNANEFKMLCNNNRYTRS